MIEQDVDPSGDFGPITILCVGTEAEAVSNHLVELGDGLDAVSVQTYEEARDRLDDESHDCIVSCLDLPDVDPLTFLRNVREKYEHLPFVLLSGGASEQTAADAVNLDADGYFRIEDGVAEQAVAVRERIETVVQTHRVQKTRTETRKRLLQLAESSDSAVWMFTADWEECIYVNETYEDLWGRSRETLEENPMDFMEGIHPEDREMVTDAMGSLLQGDSVELEYRVNPKEDFQRWVKVQGQPVFDHAGNVSYLAGFARDVTERREHEQQLQRQNDEMEVFNSLLRHDVLNGITVIRTRSEILAEELEGDQQQYAATIVEWSDNMTGLVQRIRDVLTTLTGEEPELERVNLSKSLREQASTVEQSYPQVEFEREVPPDVYVTANELLSDVFKNLLTNAVEHNEEAGLRIAASVDVEHDSATVRIADNGTGIPDERKEEVFRRGQTGHVKQTGSGFGLFFVDAMLTAYGGDVRVEDNEMGGATFVLTLERASAESGVE